MQLGSTRAFLGATAIALACLAGAVTVKAAGQAAPAQDTPVLTDQAFKNIQVLKGISVDTFFDSMGMFANAMGNDCTYCHSPKAALEREGFAIETPRINRARGMIAMVNAINRNYFQGQPRVTCFTCHHGNQSPRSDPNLALQYSTPDEDPNARDFPTDQKITADQVFTKYIQAVGGADRLSKLTSFTAKGTYEGFDTLFEKVPVEIFAKAPNQFMTLVHMKDGNSFRTYNGTAGWLAGPDTAVPIIPLTGGNLDRAKFEALVAFPAGLRGAYSQWRVGRAVLNDQEVMIAQAAENGQPVASLYFDPAGLLVRLVRWNLTPVGYVPTQIDYSDYRDVAGVKIAYKRKVSQTYMQMSVELSEVTPNVAVDTSRFARPTPFTAKRFAQQ